MNKEYIRTNFVQMLYLKDVIGLAQPYEQLCFWVFMFSDAKSKSIRVSCEGDGMVEQAGAKLGKLSTASVELCYMKQVF